MKAARSSSSSRPTPSRQLADLRARLAEAEETLHAIHSGEVDAVVVAGKAGPQVFTLQGAEHAYRILIESMNEGALTLTADATILFANRCFAKMVRRPLEQVIGGSFHRFLATEDRVTLRPLLKRTGTSGSKIQVHLRADDGSQMPAQISLRPLVTDAASGATLGMVVTDLTEARRTEELLRALTHRVVQVQEAERARVALVLHDHIIQPLCSILFRSQALERMLSVHDGPAKDEAIRLREMLGQTAEEAERLARNLRPSVLEQLGLVAVLRSTTAEFAERTGVSVKLACVKMATRLPANIELALYRILQEALENVLLHARARQVSVRLAQMDVGARLLIKDDGIGFDPDPRSSRRQGDGGLGLLSMGERATYVGGVLSVKSARRVGTVIEVRIPLPPTATATD